MNVYVYIYINTVYVSPVYPHQLILLLHQLYPALSNQGATSCIGEAGEFLQCVVADSLQHVLGVVTCQWRSRAAYPLVIDGNLENPRLNWLFIGKSSIHV